MSQIDALIQELQWESANTRRMLERVPEDKMGWKPHDRSMSMGQLASHIAESAGWATVALETESFEMPSDWAPFVAANHEELMDKFDASLASALHSMEGCTDEELQTEWSVIMGGQTVLQMPRANALRSMVLNHIVHHRGQLGVYLRLNDIPVPSVYGPSADEQPER